MAICYLLMHVFINVTLVGVNVNLIFFYLKEKGNALCLVRGVLHFPNQMASYN